jgi:hypothetical protein
MDFFIDITQKYQIPTYLWNHFLTLLGDQCSFCARTNELYSNHVNFVFGMHPLVECSSTSWLTFHTTIAVLPRNSDGETGRMFPLFPLGYAVGKGTKGPTLDRMSLR